MKRKNRGTRRSRIEGVTTKMTGREVYAGAVYRLDDFSCSIGAI